MRLREAILSILIMLAPLLSGFPCSWFEDDFATEVVLSRPGIYFNLEPIKRGRNVNRLKKNRYLLFEEYEGAFVYRSHYDSRMAAILEDIKAPNGLWGISVRIQIPMKVLKWKRVRTDIDLPLKWSEFKLDEEKLRMLGYKLNVRSYSEDEISLDIMKDDLKFHIAGYKTRNGKRLNIRGYFPDRRYEEIKEAFEAMIHDLGLDPLVLKRLEVHEDEFTSFDVVKAVDIDETKFDFPEAMRVELEWLRENGIVRKLTDKDIEDICRFAVRGNAGWNYRVVYDGRRWIKYSLIPGVALADCGGISEMVLIQSSVIPELPEGEIQIDPISPRDKLLTVWGRLRGQ
ncbi:hypothetical protein J7M22_03255 [Candidatus Poribacteria bacterium]|nr:hypothetical protein [Candidatus Poribacteria bacterium]